jgi:hypothetical protein
MLKATLVAVFAGVLYGLSPASAWMALAFALVVGWAARGLPAAERRRVVALLLVSGALRAIAIAAIAWRNDPRQHSFSTVFGDALYAIRMSLWIRYTYLGVPIEARDYLEVFDINNYGRTSYHTMLAIFQVFVGDAPYGVHVLSAVLYLAGVVAMFRIVRPRFGPIAAFAGLSASLFMPSLFLWSILPLKESAYFFCTAIAISAVVSAARARTWIGAGASLLLAAGTLVSLSSLREGGLVIAVGGLALGIAATLAVRWRFVLIILLVATPFVAVGVLSRPTVHDQILESMRDAVARHLGHVRTPGASYKLLKLDYYRNDIDARSLSFSEGVQYVGRSLVAFVLIPKPWEPATRSQIYMAPQQVVWYGLLVLAVVGAVAGLRRDRLLTCLLAGNVIVGVIVIAPNSGNVGTLIRHRDMVVPFVAWLSGMGVLAVMSQAAAIRARHQTQEDR